MVDLVYAGPAVLSETGNFSIMAPALRILVTAIYLVGLPERRVPAVGGVGQPNSHDMSFHTDSAEL